MSDNQKDGYGFQSAEDPKPDPFRYKRVTVDEDGRHVEYSATPFPEETAMPPETRIEATNAEEEPDYQNDPAYVEVRTRIYDRVPSGTSFRQNGALIPVVLNIVTNRFTTSYRKRTPEDGDAKFVMGEPNIQPQFRPEAIEPAGFGPDVRRKPVDMIADNSGGSWFYNTPFYNR